MTRNLGQYEEEGEWNPPTSASQAKYKINATSASSPKLARNWRLRIYPQQVEFNHEKFHFVRSCDGSW